MKLHKDIESILITKEQIENSSQKVANYLNKKYKNKHPIVLGILKGCIPFYNEVFSRLTCDPIMDFMIVSSYSGVHSSNIKIVADLRQNIQGRHIIIVEDIIDTGKTLHKLIEILSTRKPASIEIVCLVDKPHARAIEVKIGYACFEIPHKFVVGFGLDYNEGYRYLPYVGVLKKSIYAKMDK
ncbi:MAG: hypoxanthine phosphoribosyltransferase [Mycoplasmataceae bacterium]|jgi:hypoxanthine phosphoribosyltransferase|nr:hypoxanthine phosphoribosyltransferase [Mycoplasmataceae bacterium]